MVSLPARAISTKRARASCKSPSLPLPPLFEAGLRLLSHCFRILDWLYRSHPPTVYHEQPIASQTVYPVLGVAVAVALKGPLSWA